MSRRAGHLIVVEEDGEGAPLKFRPQGEGEPPHPAALPILRVLEYHREWVGILDGSPERDVYLVETSQGICELHRLRDPVRAAAEGALETPVVPGNGEPPVVPTIPDRWILTRWED